jgi:phage tail sheath gpL-like
MPPISTALSLAIRTRLLGYKIVPGDFAEESENLPMRVIILAEVNSNKQDVDAIGFDFNVPIEITTLPQAGKLFGYGSPVDMMMRIMRPKSGTGLGAIPTFVIPLAEPDGATAKTYEIEVTGTATKNYTHKVYIAGRDGIDGKFYNVNIVKDDTADDIAAKIEDTVNNVLNCPFTAAAPDASEPESNICTLTSKWKGATANDLVVEMYANGDDAGISYVITSPSDGAGVPDIADALAAIGNEWFTIGINSLGTDTSVMSALEQFNGKPSTDGGEPSGKYAGEVMRPCVWFTGTTVDNPSTISDARADSEVTIALCPAPLSDGHPFEAAANFCVLFAPKMQDKPHLDICGQSLPDMPIPLDKNIGSMADWETRQSYVLKGCSTVSLVAEKYMVEDFVTTYHKEGEDPLQFSIVRNLVGVDLNVYWTYYQKEQLHVVDHVICNDADKVSADKIVKPKMWKAVLNKMFVELTDRALIAEPEFSQANLQVQKSSTNPNRFETRFKYKRTATVKQSSTDAIAGFN